LCSSAIAAAIGGWAWLGVGLFFVSLLAMWMSRRGQARADRALLAEFREHQAAIASHAVPSATLSEAARALVDAAEVAIGDAAARVSQIQSQLEVARADRSNPLASASVAKTDTCQFKNAFVSKVSHELRTPLAGIKAYIELLIDGEAQDETTRREFYNVIQNETNRLGRLIDDILSISRIEAGIARVQVEPVEINHLLNNAIAKTAEQVARKSLTLCWSQADPVYQTRGDRAMLEQAVLTLLNNAIMFSPHGARISVETATNPHQKMVLIRFIDQGPRIEPKDVPGVFDKFSGGQTSARTAGGAGVGLALVRQIVESVHRGAVFAETHPGSGNCFGFALELYVPEPARLTLEG
ncbi:MAG TPA: histidine kinase dimerization/phospho-acceptor domain-containing protein, partial [Tepidisphaeraceae bacterium]